MKTRNTNCYTCQQGRRQISGAMSNVFFSHTASHYRLTSLPCGYASLSLAIISHYSAKRSQPGHFQVCAKFSLSQVCGTVSQSQVLYSWSFLSSQVLSVIIALTMSSRSRRSSSMARRGRRSAPSTSNEAQPVSDKLAALTSSTVREEIRHLSTAPPPTLSSADRSASASSADHQSASASPVSPPPGCDDLLGPPMGLDLEAGLSTSPSTSQSAALPSAPPNSVSG